MQIKDVLTLRREIDKMLAEYEEACGNADAQELVWFIKVEIPERMNAIFGSYGVPDGGIPS